MVEFENLPFPKRDESTSDSEARAVSRSQSHKDDFERTYGPAVQSIVQSASTYICFLEFYPRQHLAKDLIAKAGKMLEDAARLSAEKRAVAALPEIMGTLRLL